MQLVVHINMPDHMDEAYVEAHKEDFFPLGDNRISIDNAILEVDPTDDSFYMFEFVGYN